MVWRALFGLFYGDLLMLLLHQTRPYEKKPGEAKRLWQKWIDRLGEDLRTGRHLTIHHMKRNFYRIAGEFAGLDRQRKLPQGQIVSANVDSSGSRLNVYNRIRMLVDL